MGQEEQSVVRVETSESMCGHHMLLQHSKSSLTPSPFPTLRLLKEHSHVHSHSEFPEFLAETAAARDWWPRGDLKWSPRGDFYRIYLNCILKGYLRHSGSQKVRLKARMTQPSV